MITLGFGELRAVNALTVGFVYLITILVLATSWGLAESIAASVTATTCLNFFFLPPVGTFTIAEPENWVALLTFLLTSLVASQLSDRAKRRAVEATLRRIEVERLYELSQAIMLMDVRQPAGSQIAGEIGRIYGLPWVAIYEKHDGAIHCSGSGDVLRTFDLFLKQVAAGPAGTYRNELAEVLIAPVTLAGQAIGSIGMKGGSMSEPATQALANLVAIVLENARSRDAALRAEATQQSEEFKSTLLDGLAHEFQTPLTAMKAATSGLLTSNAFDTRQQQELLTIIDQEADHLSGLVTEAIQLARIEAGKLELNKTLCSPGKLIEAALARMDPVLEERLVETDIGDSLPEIWLDADLVQLALRQLIDNAIKYSPPGSAVRISARAQGEAVAIGVHNSGAPLSTPDKLRVFDKFYRGATAQPRVAGTGMGLPIARGIVQKHGGDIHVESAPGAGTEFVIVIPMADREVRT